LALFANIATVVFIVNKILIGNFRNYAFFVANCANKLHTRGLKKLYIYQARKTTDITANHQYNSLTI